MPPSAPQLSPHELEVFKETFELFDADGGGTIDASELGGLMQARASTPASTRPYLTPSATPLSRLDTSRPTRSSLR